MVFLGCQAFASPVWGLLTQHAGLRTAVLVAAGLVALSAAGVGASGFAWLNVALTVVWLAVAGQIAREHRRRTV